MKALKKIIFVLIAIVAVLFVITLFLPSDVTVSNKMTVNAPAEVCYDQVADLKNWEKWSPWSDMDPTMKVTYGETTSGVGASYSWAGEKSGEGTLTVSDAVPAKSLKTALDFGPQGKGSGEWTFNEEEGATDVTWSFTAHMGSNPIGKMMGLFMEKQMTPMMMEGLSGIKEIAEATPAAPEINIAETSVNGGYAMTMRKTVSQDEMEATISACKAAIQTVIADQGLEMQGHPFTIYHAWDPPTNVDMEIGIQVTSKGKTAGDVTAIDMPSGMAVMGQHYGSHDKLGDVHYAIDEWMKSNGKAPAGAPWEVYVTDPTTVSDPSQVLTEVYYPIGSAE
ncbi:MAG: hypothetical protein HKN22_03355 [Bacteroidia bacterium]|nr:hypothetical protein [Bacteroidia bacterium]